MVVYCLYVPAEETLSDDVLWAHSSIAWLSRELDVIGNSVLPDMCPVKSRSRSTQA